VTDDELITRVEVLADTPTDALESSGAREVFDALIAGLEAGTIRAAEPAGDGWRVNTWVKQGILLGFRLGRVIDVAGAGALSFSDKDTYPTQRLDGPGRGIRVVPGGSSVRAGAYIGDRVTMMPPAYVNVGAWVGEGTMIDSHALIGSCAQVGSRVHVSAAAQIGGVLEPIGAMPVIVEDEVFVGGNTGIYEGTIVKRHAVIAAGVILTGSTPVYDLVNESVLRRAAGGALTIPEGAVVVPGTRPARGAYAEAEGVQLAVPVIVKYRDEKSDAATSLEEALR
jgi:2,3,4,5-tetrahydropyridine-2-carboxylate N-succinyltransferase